MLYDFKGNLATRESSSQMQKGQNYNFSSTLHVKNCLTNFDVKKKIIQK